LIVGDLVMWDLVMGAPFDGLGWKFESAHNLVQSRLTVDPMFMVIGIRY
jgi:hypothetical protein